MRRRRFALPFWVAFGLFYLAPVLYLLERSFHRRDPLGGFRGAYALDAWHQLVDPLTLVVLRRSLLLAVGVTLLSLVLATSTALWVRRLAVARRRWVLLLLWLPLFMNSLLFTYGYILFLRLEGPLNQVLLALHLIRESVPFLFTPGAVLLGLCASFFSFCFFPVYVGVSRIEARYLHVAADLGATPWQTTKWVLLPLLRPSWLAGAALVFVPMLGEFLVPDLLGGGKVVTYATFIRLQFTGYANWSLGAALASSLVVVGVALQVFALRLARDIEVFR